MKTSDITLSPIDNENHVNLFWESIKNEPTIDNMKKEDWVGEFIYDIYYKGNHAGFISYSNWKESCCLSCVYVFPKYRRLGIATAAIRKIYYMTKDYQFFYGFVHKNNFAIKMYQNLGFKFLDKNGFYSVDNPTVDSCKITQNFYEFGGIRK